MYPINEKKKNRDVIHKTSYPLLNPLGPNSDQHQFSPNNINMLPREMVMSVNKMISKEKIMF